MLKEKLKEKTDTLLTVIPLLLFILLVVYLLISDPGKSGPF
jgi:hypothetical protein